MDQSVGRAKYTELSNEELLDLYLSLPPKQREERFVCTRCVADLTSLSIRTIQFWIETGVIRAVLIGKNYRVDLDSVRAHLKRQIYDRQS